MSELIIDSSWTFVLDRSGFVKFENSNCQVDEISMMKLNIKSILIKRVNIPAITYEFFIFQFSFDSDIIFRFGLGGGIIRNNYISEQCEIYLDLHMNKFDNNKYSICSMSIL